jgi:hypothetical protein
VCAKFGVDWVILVNLTFDLNDLDLCQIRPHSGTPGIKPDYMSEKFDEDRAIGVGGVDGQTHKQTHLKF